MDDFLNKFSCSSVCGSPQMSGAVMPFTRGCTLGRWALCLDQVLQARVLRRPGGRRDPDCAVLVRRGCSTYMVVTTLQSSKHVVYVHVHCSVWLCSSLACSNFQPCKRRTTSSRAC